MGRWFIAFWLVFGLGFMATPAWAATSVRVVVLSLEKASAMDVDGRLRGRLGQDVRKSLANSPYKKTRILKDARFRLEEGASAEVPIPLAKGQTKLRVELLEAGPQKTKMRLRCPGIDNLNTVTSHANGGTLLLAVPGKGRAIAIVPGL
ncbi:MAG: hypothetical protein AAGD10_00585 [Myxococcota bacterium]